MPVGPPPERIPPKVIFCGMRGITAGGHTREGFCPEKAGSSADSPHHRKKFNSSLLVAKTDADDKLKLDYGFEGVVFAVGHTSDDALHFAGGLWKQCPHRSQAQRRLQAVEALSGTGKIELSPLERWQYRYVQRHNHNLSPVEDGDRDLGAARPAIWADVYVDGRLPFALLAFFFPKIQVMAELCEIDSHDAGSQERQRRDNCGIMGRSEVWQL